MTQHRLFNPIAAACVCLALLGGCATPDYKARTESRDGFARAQPIVEKLLQYKAKRGLFPIALSDIGEGAQESFYYQPAMGGDSYVLSFDYSLLPQMVRCTRTNERDWICARL